MTGPGVTIRGIDAALERHYDSLDEHGHYPLQEDPDRKYILRVNTILAQSVITRLLGVTPELHTRYRFTGFDIYNKICDAFRNETGLVFTVGDDAWALHAQYWDWEDLTSRWDGPFGIELWNQSKNLL